MRAFPGAFKMTIEVASIAEARRAVRLWSLIADFLILIWKGPMVSSSVMFPAHGEMSTLGGGGYLLFRMRGKILNAGKLNGTTVKIQADEAAMDPLAVLFAPYSSLLPAEVGAFLSNEALSLFASGRLLVVPSTGIGSVALGHGFIDGMFAEACDALPAIKGSADSQPPTWLPYFADAPLEAMCDVIADHELPLSRLRTLILRRAREFRASGIVGSEAKELELELRDALRQLGDAQGSLRRKHGWSVASEGVASVQDGFNNEALRPVLVLQTMGYGWRVERANVAFPSQQPVHMPDPDEPICSWLHPPDTKPRFISGEEVKKAMQATKGKRR